MRPSLRFPTTTPTERGVARDASRAVARRPALFARALVVAVLGAVLGGGLGGVVALGPATASRAAEAAAAPAAKPSPAFRAAMKRFLLAQNIPTQMGEQMAYSAAEQFLAPLAANGVAVTEPMQALVLDEARKDFGKRYGDVEYLTDLYSGVYAQHFTDAEITELAAFWESPVAKKLLSTTEKINETFVTQLQSATKTQMDAFQSRMEKELRAAGILGDAP